MRGSLLEVDVAHAGESWQEAHATIIRALNDAINNNYKGLKIIHGYGSLTGEAVIGPRAIALMRHLAEEEGGRFVKDQNNPGSSLIWLNRPGTKQPDKDAIFYSTESKNEGATDWFEQAKKKKF
jgi:hypothetical protein